MRRDADVKIASILIRCVLFDDDDGDDDEDAIQPSHCSGQDLGSTHDAWLVSLTFSSKRDFRCAISSVTDRKTNPT